MAPNSTIIVMIRIGHTAKIMPHPQDSFTHEWTAYVKGADGIDLSHFVERVVFKLHETFQRPIQVKTEPPYSITERGYASFALKVEIVFKNTDKLNHIEYEYDLVLPGEGQPPVRCYRQEKLIFRNTPDDFRMKLLDGGAIETDPEAKLEMASKEKASSGPKNEISSLASDDPLVKMDVDKIKKKKIKDKQFKKKKDDDDKQSSLFGVSLSHDEKRPNQGTPKGTISRSDNSLSSDGSSSDSSDSPAPMAHISESKNRLSAYAVSSDDDDNTSQQALNRNNSNVNKRPYATPTQNGAATSKKPKSDKDLRPTKKSERTTVAVKKAPNGMPLDILLDLHEKMKDASDPDVLQSFVDLIEETGQYKITDTSFDFDLCLLDSSVIHKLEALFK